MRAEGNVSVAPSRSPARRETPSSETTVRRHSAPRLDRDFREEEIRELRAAICRRPPSPGDSHWSENDVWIGCTEIELDKTSGPGDFVRITIKVTTEQDTDDVWSYYQAHQAEIMASIRSTAPGGNVRIKSVRIERGSVSIFVIVQIVIGLMTIAVAILGNYDNIERNFKRAMPLIKQYVIDTIANLKGLFGRFGFG